MKGTNQNQTYHLWGYHMWQYCELRSYGEVPYTTVLKYFEMLETAETNTTEYETHEDMKRGLHTQVFNLSASGWELVNVVEGVYKFRRDH